jgi:hypothetical protein
MGVTKFGAVKISRTDPKISVKIVNNIYDTDGAFLRVMRVGEPVPFAEYPPTRITGTGYFEFMFDDLLFDEAPGRYYAELIMEGLPRQDFYLQYIDNVEVTVSSDF